MNTVEIPGGKATFKEAKELRGRDRLLIKAAAIAAAPAIGKYPEGIEEDVPGETPEAKAARQAEMMEGVTFTWQEAMQLLELRQATIIATLASWTLPLPLPTMESIGDLPGDLYEALEEAIGGTTTAVAAAKSFDPTNEDLDPRGGTDTPFTDSELLSQP